jgi:Nuclease-related domain
MANIYPENTEANNSPEQFILNKIRSELSNEWTVIHSLKISKHIKNRLGEIDFVAFTNDCLLVLEVKGGEIASHRGMWYQNQKPMKQSPFDQAWNNFFSLESYLKENGFLAMAGGIVCVFPDSQLVSISPSDSSPSFERGQFIGINDVNMFGIGVALEECRKNYLDEWKRIRKHTPPTLSAELLNQLIELLVPTVILNPLFDIKIKNNQKRLVELDEKQYEFLTDLNIPRILLDGPAGSGKTILGYKACKNWLKKNPGKRAAFICCSDYLKNDIKKWILRDGLQNQLWALSKSDILSNILKFINREKDFHVTNLSWEFRNDEFTILLLGKIAHITDDTNREYINACIENDLVEYITLPRFGLNFKPENTPYYSDNLAFDFVVVDEAQDFCSDISGLHFLNLFIKGGLNNGNVIWIQDLNQTIPQEKYVIPLNENKFPIFSPQQLNYFVFKLKRINYRNPLSINILSSNLLPKEECVLSVNEENSFPQNIILISSGAKTNKLDEEDQLGSNIVNAIIQLSIKGVQFNDIIIISLGERSELPFQEVKLSADQENTSGKNSSRAAILYFKHATLGVDKESMPNNLTENTIYWSNLFDAKGREFPVVILIDLPDLKTEIGKAKAYIGATRATSLLWVMGNDEELDMWEELIKYE